MGRARSPRKAGWPENLYESRGYYSWRDPRDKKTHGLGREFKAAAKEARAANALVYTERLSLVERLDRRMTFNDFVPQFRESLDEKERSRNTQKTDRSYLRAAQLHLGKRPIASITTADCEGVIRAFREQGKLRSAQAIRSFLKEFFRVAEAKGAIPRASNPAEITGSVVVKTKRARLTLEDFNRIYTAAITLDPWVRNSMALALVTGQRLGDIQCMLFRPTEGATAWVEGGALWVIQGKTGAKVAIELTLRLKAFKDTSVGEVVSRCRDGVVSRFLIHHTKRRTMSSPGDPVHENTISKGFKRARELAGITGPNPPTFHEIRSLSKRLYDAQGGVDTKKLLGHSTERMSAMYADSRGAEWLRVG